MHNIGVLGLSVALSEIDNFIQKGSKQTTKLVGNCSFSAKVAINCHSQLIFVIDLSILPPYTKFQQNRKGSDFPPKHYQMKI